MSCWGLWKLCFWFLWGSKVPSNHWFRSQQNQSKTTDPSEPIQISEA
jgi:hypothetical protein